MPFHQPRRELDFAYLGALLFEERQRLVDPVEGRGTYFIVGFVEMPNDADLHALDVAAEFAAIVRDRAIGARWITRVVPRERLQQDGAILHRPSHRANVIAAECGRRDAAAADESVSGLDAGNTAERRRAADRAARIGSQATENKARGDGGTGATARPGGEVIRVPRISRRRPWQIEGRTAVSEFVRRQFAEEDGSRLGEQGCDGSVGGGNIVLELRRMTCRLDAFGIDNVLEPDRDPGQLAFGRAVHHSLFCLARIAQRAIGCHRDESEELVVQSLDLGEARLSKLDGRQFLLLDELRSLGDGQKFIRHAKLLYR